MDKSILRIRLNHLPSQLAYFTITITISNMYLLAARHIHLEHIVGCTCKVKKSGE